MSGKKSSLDYVFVGIQVVLFLAYFLTVDFSFRLVDWTSYAGLLFMALGSNLIVAAILQLKTTLSPFPTPVADGSLVTTGVFAIARHPIYLGILMAGTGYALYAGSYLHLGLSMALAILFYYKSDYEERLLSAVYPEYADYQMRVGRFTPWVLG